MKKYAVVTVGLKKKEYPFTIEEITFKLDIKNYMGAVETVMSFLDCEYWIKSAKEVDEYEGSKG